MNDYTMVRFTFEPCSETETDILAALLADIDFETFLPDENGVTAYVKKELYNEAKIANVLQSYPFAATITHNAEIIEGEDWNSEWEKNYFKPIILGDECMVHSSFHTNLPKAKYDIVIDPKMAFGTGHHETTTLMVERILNEPISGKKLIDMGTGTGILAILAAMRGATDVTGIEIDEMAYVNAVENIKLNNHPEIKLILGDASQLPQTGTYDYLFANINRNIILGDMDKYAKAVVKGGYLIFSGFFSEDIPMLTECAHKLGLEPIQEYAKTKWASLKLQKIADI